MTSLSWRPVLKGKIFCSPACGGKCTRAAYEKAILDAFELTEELGDGWIPKVSENMRWHYHVISPCGRLEVWPGFTAFLNSPGEGGGRFSEHRDTAMEAIIAVIRKGREERDLLIAILDGLEE